VIDLHFWPTPNGKKVTILLEECGLPYRIVPCNIGRGDQFSDAFLGISPNNRMLALVDHEPADGGPPLSVFESGAMMMYIAEKAGRFYPQALRGRYEPQAIIDADEDFSRVMHLLDSGHFRRFEPGALDAVIQSIRKPADQWMTAADFRSFIDAQREADATYRDAERWTRMSILNSAASGRFSTDRTMRDYNDDIWHLEPINLDVAKPK